MRLAAVAVAAALAVGGCAGLASGAKPSSDLPAEKQSRENQYETDQSAGKANQHSRSEDTGQAPEVTNDVPVSGFPTRPAGNGTIVETGDSGPPGTDEFEWKNEWYLKTPTRLISVYAGSRRAAPAQGVLFVTVWTADESQLLQSLVINTPRVAGAVHFVGGQGVVAQILATDGTSFSFDASLLAVR